MPGPELGVRYLPLCLGRELEGIVSLDKLNEHREGQQALETQFLKDYLYGST